MYSYPCIPSTHAETISSGMTVYICAGDLPDTADAATGSTGESAHSDLQPQQLSAALQPTASLLPTVSTTSPAYASLTFKCGDTSSSTSVSGHSQHHITSEAHTSHSRNTGSEAGAPQCNTSEAGSAQHLPAQRDSVQKQRESAHVQRDSERAQRDTLPIDAAAAELAASIWAALPEEHQIFQQCSKLAEARRRALAGSLLDSNTPAAALSCIVPPVIKHVEVMQGQDGCTPADDLETLHMLHVALKERVQRAPATRVWHLTARRTFPHLPVRTDSDLLIVSGAKLVPLLRLAVFCRARATTGKDRAQVKKVTENSCMPEGR